MDKRLMYEHCPHPIPSHPIQSRALVFGVFELVWNPILLLIAMYLVPSKFQKWESVTEACRSPPLPLRAAFLQAHFCDAWHLGCSGSVARLYSALVTCCPRGAFVIIESGHLLFIDGYLVTETGPSAAKRRAFVVMDRSLSRIWRTSRLPRAGRCGCDRSTASAPRCVL
jgi:hypothetical protein